MKNKIFKIALILVIVNFFNSTSFSENQFNFDVTNLEILENGNVFKGLNKGIITTNDGIKITADSFEYNKNLNILNAKGNVKIEDIIQNYLIFSENITYEKNKEKIFTQNNSRAVYQDGKKIDAENFEIDIISKVLNANGNVKIEDNVQNYIIYAENITYDKNLEKIFTKGFTKSNIQTKYFFQSNNLEFLLNEKKISSREKSTVKDKYSNLLKLDSFVYLIDQEQIKGSNIIFINNFGLPKSDKIFFTNAIIDLKNQEFISKDTKIELHNDAFDNPENNPRIKGVSSQKKQNITSIKKGVFTSCNSKEKCPPWSIEAKEIKHDKDKKQLIYDSALLKIYNLPILYFPKFFHPDPSVKRQSGFLKPKLNNSNILGSSFTLPYYHVSAINSDFTITPTLFSNNIKMIQTELRHVGNNSSLVADLGHTRGYKSEFLNKKKNINHFFGKLNLDLDLKNFNLSNINFNFEKISNDTYLKVFDANIVSKELKPDNFDELKNEIQVNLENDKFVFNAGIRAFEDLQKKIVIVINLYFHTMILIQ